MKFQYKVLEHNLIAKDTYEMILKTDDFKVDPGQFVEIKVDDLHFIRRPISISSYQNGKMTLIYKVLGSGTQALSTKKPKDQLDILGPLGTGYQIKTDKNHQILVGGGIGVPPLYQLAKEMKAKGLSFSVILGFNNKEDVFYEQAFKALTDNVYVATMDGTYGHQGTVLDVIKDRDINFDYYYACGPKPMLNALLREKTEGQLSFEERMGCGFGACMGCSMKTTTGYKRICKEGPVLESKEVLIDE